MSRSIKFIFILIYSSITCDWCLGTTHNRGDLLPPPPPAYLDIFPDHPSGSEVIHQHTDDCSCDTPISSNYQHQLNETVRCLQEIVSNTLRSRTDELASERTGRIARYSDILNFLFLYFIIKILFCMIKISTFIDF